ncbi:MAG: ABC transporter ATP-binding protein [Anaerolinea sp.]
MNFIVEMQGITKRFGVVEANQGIDFDLKPGEIHALLGENGAGKTTLMRILYGLYRADEGEIRVAGKPVVIHSPKDAIGLGIGMVTQHFTLVPPLSVVENVALGQEGAVTLDLDQMRQRVVDAAKRFGIEIKPDALVRHLSVGERQRVEILKSLYRNARVLILDEPTAVLVPQEVEALFQTLNKLRESGMALVFISHKLNEVMELCDRITVLRDGKKIGTVLRGETNEAELARMMVGRETFGVVRPAERRGGEVRLKLDKINALDKKGLPALKNISLEVRAGEILGIAGISGNGQSELAQVLSGMLKPVSGTVWVDGKDMTGASPADFAAANIGRVPEDRHSGVVGDLSVAENLVLEHLEEFSRNGMMDYASVQKFAQKMIEDFQIKARPQDPIRTLSGGNMQKVLLARALAHKPRVLIVAQPTRGLDIGATDYVRSKLLEQREAGTAILMISEDLDEILALSDRIAVMYEGRIVGIVSGRRATPEVLGMMMSGALEVDYAEA